MKRKLVVLFFVLSAISAVVAYVGYTWIYSPNVKLSDATEILIPTGSTYEKVKEILIENDIIKNEHSFDLVSKLMKYDQSVKSGRYLIGDGLSNKHLITKLRAGRQDPVNVTISTARFISDIAGIVAEKIEADSVSILSTLTDAAILADNGLTPETAITQIIPNTYEFYWNTSAEQFRNRMKREYDKFWDDQVRKSKLIALGMTKEEVITMASLIEKETNFVEERPTMAGVYVNRVRQGIPLQADPTVVFGLKAFDIRRVLNKHLAIDTPYNTYMHKGLPPGPICMPSLSSIDAVLNAEKHDYIFFCAKPGYNNGHLFAASDVEHARNARKYHRWLDSEGIKG